MGGREYGRGEKLETGAEEKVLVCKDGGRRKLGERQEGERQEGGRRKRGKEERGKRGRVEEEYGR
jgi:hypothetical protein